MSSANQPVAARQMTIATRDGRVFGHRLGEALIIYFY